MSIKIALDGIIIISNLSPSYNEKDGVFVGKSEVFHLQLLLKKVHLDHFADAGNMVIAAIPFLLHQADKIILRQVSNRRIPTFRQV